MLPSWLQARVGKEWAEVHVHKYAQQCLRISFPTFRSQGHGIFRLEGRPKRAPSLEAFGVRIVKAAKARQQGRAAEVHEVLGLQEGHLKQHDQA